MTAKGRWYLDGHRLDAGDVEMRDGAPVVLADVSIRWGPSMIWPSTLSLVHDAPPYGTVRRRSIDRHWVAWGDKGEASRKWWTLGRFRAMQRRLQREARQGG